MRALSLLAPTNGVLGTRANNGSTKINADWLNGKARRCRAIIMASRTSCSHKNCKWAIIVAAPASDDGGPRLLLLLLLLLLFSSLPRHVGDAASPSVDRPRRLLNGPPPSVFPFYCTCLVCVRSCSAFHFSLNMKYSEYVFCRYIYTVDVPLYGTLLQGFRVNKKRWFGLTLI